MDIRALKDRQWTSTDYPGIERCLFRNHAGGGRSSLVRLAAGARFPAHQHQAAEEVLVLAGEVDIGGHRLAAGDWLYTEAGETHAVHALSDALIYVSSALPTPLVPHSD